MEKQVDDIWKFGLECLACEPAVPAKGSACPKCDQKAIGSKRTSNADAENSKQKIEDKGRRIYNVASHFIELV
jgi:rRNA maturation endonuclease Nob1